jgi:hypothetical protein
MGVCSWLPVRKFNHIAVDESETESKEDIFTHHILFISEKETNVMKNGHGNRHFRN